MVVDGKFALVLSECAIAVVVSIAVIALLAIPVVFFFWRSNRDLTEHGQNSRNMKRHQCRRIPHERRITLITQPALQQTNP
jgi:hypothetical protein